MLALVTTTLSWACCWGFSYVYIAASHKTDILRTQRQKAELHIWCCSLLGKNISTHFTASHLVFWFANGPRFYQLFSFSLFSFFFVFFLIIVSKSTRLVPISVSLQVFDLHFTKLSYVDI